MDVRAYFHKVRDLEQKIKSPWVVVVSEDTPDGGKAGVLTEISRDVAAQLVVDGRARLATEAEAEQYREEAERARAAAEEERLAGKMQVTMMTEESLRALKATLKKV